MSILESKLTPGLDIKNIIGIKIPVLRNIAKQYMKDEELKQFLTSLPHKYLDENILHGLLISELKDYINENMKLSSENIFYKYLSKIYSNLIQREENINKSKAKKFSREQKSNLFLQKDLLVNNLVPDKFNQDESNLSLNIFLDYFINFIFSNT